VASLRVKSGPLAGQTIDLTEEVVIGRENADFTIDDPEISRRHVVIRRLGGAVEIEDLGSSNGTFVDDQRIEAPTRVGGGAMIRLGNTVLEVEGILPVQRTRLSGVADPQTTKARAIPEPQVTRARAIPEDRPIAEPQPTTARAVPTEAAAAAAPPAPPTEQTPPAPRAPAPGAGGLAGAVGQFSPPTQKRSRGLASRSWVPVALSFGTVILTAIALVIYFAAR
jgi:pSer/pThr/pTyr-binding forkhead associated (FHA) protein